MFTTSSPFLVSRGPGIPGVRRNCCRSNTVTGCFEHPRVRRLVGSADTGDQARLASHFSALAERYAAQARRHTAMARAFTGNPNRQMATGWASHCERLAKLNTQSADTVRELAAHHQRLATGTASTAPQAGASFEAGAGALTPSDEDLVALAAKASTPADSRALAEYFVTLEKHVHGRRCGACGDGRHLQGHANRVGSGALRPVGQTRAQVRATGQGVG